MIFNFTVEQINLILNALGNMPYVQVAGMISNIQKQAQDQIQDKNKVEVTGLQDAR